MRQGKTTRRLPSARTGSQSQSPSAQKRMPGRRKQKVEDRGLEPVPSSPQKTPLLKQGGAESGALFGDDERLRVLLEAWPELPESVKTAVL